MRFSSFLGVATAAATLAGGCAPSRQAAPLPPVAFPAPDGLEGMRTRIPVDLDFASPFVRLLVRSGIAVREVTHVRPGDFFANSPRAVHLVTELGDAEVMFLPTDAALRGRARVPVGAAARQYATDVRGDTSSAPTHPLYFVARRDVFVVTGSVVLYDAIQRVMRTEPSADS